MTYENAASTRLIATHCACCHRPLRDAVSVERGVGPDCAEKYGYGEAQQPANWLVVAVALTGPAEITHEGIQMDAFLARDAHKLANVLVHRIASNPDAEETNGRFLAAIRGAGFVTLADKLATHLKEWKRPVITVTYEGQDMVLTCEGLAAKVFDAYLFACRMWSGRAFDKARKAFLVNVNNKRKFLALLQKEMPVGEVVTIRSEKGEMEVSHVDAETAAEREAIRTEPVAKVLPLVAPTGDCHKCGGSGHIPSYNHVEGGVCFRCRGTGKYTRPAKRVA